MKAQLVYRTLDNSDGIYRGYEQIASLHELERRGYRLHYLLGCNDKRIEQIARKFEVS